MNRRSFLTTAGLTALGAGLGASCGGRPEPMARPAPRTGPGPDQSGLDALRLVPVRVAPEREIRTVAGLRPFRRSGFRVATERRGDKTIIHNYGHGGGGVTLSWGSAHLAMEQALAAGGGECAVLGCGAVGLATARLMQRRGWRVTIYARDLPPGTTSDIAGAQWSPHAVSDPGRTTAEYRDQFVRAARLSHRYFQTLVGDRYGVRWVDNYILGDAPMPEPWFSEGIADLYPQAEALEAGAHPFGAPYARRFTTMLIEPPVYLAEMLRDVRIAGGDVVVRELACVADVERLPEPVVINCTGLGAGELFGDDEVLPIKGQLTFLLPQPEVDYIVIAGGLYMFPRTDGILLGGTHERGVDTLVPDAAAKRRILAGHARLFSAMRAPAAAGLSGARPGAGAIPRISRRPAAPRGA